MMRRRKKSIFDNVRDETETELRNNLQAKLVSCGID